MSTVNDQESTVNEVLIINYYLNYSKIRRRVNDSFISLQETLTRLYIIFNFQLSTFNLNHSHSIVAGGFELMS